MYSRMFAAILAAIGLALSAPTLAWSENGHQTVGAIANILIQGSNAETQVSRLRVRPQNAPTVPTASARTTRSPAAIAAASRAGSDPQI